MFDLCGTLKVSGCHLGNDTVCAYQKNIAYALIKFSAKSHSFNILCTIFVFGCPTTLLLLISNTL